MPKSSAATLAVKAKIYADDPVRMQLKSVRERVRRNLSDEKWAALLERGTDAGYDVPAKGAVSDAHGKLDDGAPGALPPLPDTHAALLPDPLWDAAGELGSLRRDASGLRDAAERTRRLHRSVLPSCA